MQRCLYYGDKMCIKDKTVKTSVFGCYTVGNHCIVYKGYRQYFPSSKWEAVQNLLLTIDEFTSLYVTSRTMCRNIFLLFIKCVLYSVAYLYYQKFIIISYPYYLISRCGVITSFYFHFYISLKGIIIAKRILKLIVWSKCKKSSK